MKYLLLLLLLPSISFAKLNIVTTTPSLKWLVEKIGADQVHANSLLKGHEDIHYIDAMPSFIAKAAKADALCFIGKELEIGWLPKVLERSGNSKIQNGGSGYCDAGSSVEAIEIPAGPVDRSMGDVHPSGNPHYVTGPDHFLMAALAIKKVLSALDPEHSQYFSDNYQLLRREIKAIKEAVFKKLSNVKRPIMEYHKSFSYFFHEFKLTTAGALEVIPGVPPSAGQLAKISLEAKKREVVALLAPEYAPVTRLEKFHEFSGVPYRIVPAEMKLEGPLSDYKGFMMNIVNAILLQ